MLQSFARSEMVFSRHDDPPTNRIQDDRHRSPRRRPRLDRFARLGGEPARRNHDARADPQDRDEARLRRQCGRAQPAHEPHTSFERRHPPRPRARPSADGPFLYGHAWSPGRRDHAARLRNVSAKDLAADGRLAAAAHRSTPRGRHHRDRAEHRARGTRTSCAHLRAPRRLGRPVRATELLRRRHRQHGGGTRRRRSTSSRMVAGRSYSWAIRPSRRYICAAKAIGSRCKRRATAHGPACSKRT